MTTTVIVIDNYDSFTYNLVEAFEQLDCTVLVFRNDFPIVKLQSTLASIQGPACLVLSPGPSSPHEAGFCLDLITTLKGLLPIFGICLGHQAIGVALGATLYQAQACHGESAHITHDGSALFEGVPEVFQVGRYHSLAIRNLTDFRITATLDDLVMAIEHLHYPLYGVQFHPESILTPYGTQIIRNMVTLTQQFGGTHAA